MKYLFISIFCLLLIACNNTNQKKIVSDEEQDAQFQYETDTTTVITPIDDSGEALAEDSIISFDETDPDFNTDTISD